MLRIAFDIGGVLSKHPDIYMDLLKQLSQGTYLRESLVEVFVITDMQRDKAIETLKLNGFLEPVGWIQERNVLSADYEQYGEMCKDVLLKSLGIDIFFDDFIGYVAGDGAPVRCLVMPDATKPYYHPTWKTVDDTENFGRKTFAK